MRKSLVVMAGALLFAVAARAQIYDTTEESDLRARFGFTLEKKLARGLHLSWEEELRLKGNLGDFDRIYSGLSISYKVCDFLKIGAGYTFIAIDHAGKKSTAYEKFWDLRHRLSAHITFSRHIGPRWKISLRERVLCTLRNGEVNELEKCDPAYVLRSRLMAQYTVFSRPIEPYAYVELSNTLTSPKIVDNYVDKVRTALGIKYRLNRRSSLDFYYRFDYDYNKDVNYGNKTGKLKSITTEKEYNHILGVFYRYSF